MIMQVSEQRYEKNLAFWEAAWSRVKEASLKIPEALDYIPRIPESFKKYNCKHILDIACGSGWLSFYLNEHGFEVTGVDISKSAIKLAQEVLATKPSIQTVNFYQADMFALDFPQNSFDGILINAAFEHLDYKRGQEFLQAIKAILKPQALMFAVFDKVATGAKGEFEVLDDGTHQYKDEMRDGMFLRNYSDEELKALFEKTAWKLESFEKNHLESRIVLATNQK